MGTGRGGAGRHYLAHLLQPLLQAVPTRQLQLQFLQPGDQLGREGGGVHGGHLLGQAVGSLQGAGRETGTLSRLGTRCPWWPRRSCPGWRCARRLQVQAERGRAAGELYVPAPWPHGAPWSPPAFALGRSSWSHSERPRLFSL